MTVLNDARQAARLIIRQLKITKPPIDLDLVVNFLQVNLLLKDLDDELSGLAFIENGTGFIVANKRHHPNRQRFTIAHECGHHVLHKSYLSEGPHVDKVILRRDPLSATGKDIREIAANAFAAELLMPRSIISAVIPRDFEVMADENESQLRDYASRFGVSVAAISIRLVNLS